MIRVSKPAVIVAVAMMSLHVLAAVADPSIFLTNAMITIAPLLAGLACLWRSRGQPSVLADKWRLLGVGLVIWAIGQGCYTYSTVFHHNVQTAALPSDFWFLVYGIFVLLAVCSVGEDQDSTAILIADSAQATLAIILIYVTLFMNNHFNHRALPASQLTSLYLGENLALAVTATVRLLAMPDGEDRYFHRAACTFAWLMILISTPLNYLDAYVGPTNGKAIEVGWMIPFLAVVVMAFSKEQQTRPEPLERHRSWGAMMVYNASPVFFTLCVLLLGAHTAQHRPVVGFEAVVGALLIYSFRATILQTRLRQVQESLNDSERSLRLLNSKLHEQSLIDPLTQIANRRRFEQVLEVEWNRALRSGWPISVIMLDIDHFKSLNDHYGHLRGDECLTAVAQMLGRDLRRGGELLARYGGEEFVAVLPNVDVEGAMLTAEAMRTRIHQIGIENHGSPLGRLTISVGVCSVVPVAALTREKLVDAADSALYRAKSAGRNRAERSEPLASPQAEIERPRSAVGAHLVEE
ncbi:MAG TPA: GGDEF domain-containing protein [Acidobacteriaceae bacterium]